MLIYVIWYLIVGAIATLFHPWLRGKLVELWSGEAKGKEIVGKLFFCSLGFVISCVVWPFSLRSAYLAANEPKDEFDKLLNDPRVSKSNPLFHAMLQMSADGTECDEIPGGVGEFGFVATNPVPTFNLYGSKSYLDKLGTADGRKVSYERRGSIVPEGMEKSVDVYDLSDPEGEYIATIYISPYHRKNSDRTPAGFRFRR